MALSFTAFGEAQSKGNHRAVMRPGMSFPVITEKHRSTAFWQQTVAKSASVALSRLPAAERRLLTDGVRVSLAFYLPRPKSLPKRHVAHIRKIDVDKASRAVLDALSGVAFVDDAQVCELVVGKYYARIGEPARVDVTVEATLGLPRTLAVPPVPLPLFPEQELSS